VGKSSGPLKFFSGEKNSKILSESFSWQKLFTIYQGGMVFGKINFDFLAKNFFDISGG
jgi:hypothetical protein